MAAPYIDVLSGDQVPFLGTQFPSGQITAGEPGSNLLAFLVSMRANFGFNSTPHTFEIDFIPSGTGYGHGASGNLPAINTELEMQVSGFYLKGNITHADWDSGANGTTLSIILRDKRTTLDQYKLTTDDLSGNVPSGIVSVAKEFREQNGITDPETRTWPVRNVTRTEQEADDPNFLEYQRIIEQGATYPQIRAAVSRFFGSGVAAKLPEVNKIEPNIGSDINSLRFKFGTSTLRQVLDQITLDTAFEWYWNMQNETVSLINKKLPFAIPEDKILTIIDAFGGSGLENVKNISYGIDKLTESTRIEMFGARQEGIMNSKLLSPIDGLDTIYDGGISNPSGALIFEAAWPMLSVGFYDANGFYRTYVPTEKELQMALKGIEHWTFFKRYQTAPVNASSGWGLPADAGTTAAQHPDFQSRLDPIQPLSETINNAAQNLRVINNRRDLNSNWVIEFYNRVAQHAQRHYGKSYIATHSLVYDDRVFRLASEAWCNIENQRQDQTAPFTDDYEIDRKYGPIAPFYNTRNNKVTAHCVLPSGTVYGPDGEDSPTAFNNWTEDAVPFNPSGTGEHYIPVQLAVVGQRVIDPRRNEYFSFEDFPEQTIWCQLPTIAASGIEQDDVLGNLATLVEYTFQLGQSGLNDLLDARELTIPYAYLSGVAVPVISHERYGQAYPTGWASGTADPIRGTDFIIDESLSPWNEFPEGTDTSIAKLNRRAFDRIQARRSIQQDSQFVRIGQIGLPRISFDTFSSQLINSSGLYGEREHGVNQVNISYGAGGLETSYRAESYFVTARDPGPLADRTRARLEGVIQPIDYTELDNILTGDPDNNNLATPDDFGAIGGVGLNFDFERQESATVIQISDIFNENACNYVLAGTGNTWPSEERYFVRVARQTQYAYISQSEIFPIGQKTFGHTLNSLDVGITVIPDENTVPRNKILATELDENSVVVQNDTGAQFTGTIMIVNREGAIRPTNETIRNSTEVTNRGVVCNDGYLNLGDNCVYVHKRVDGEELAYLTGGRKLNPGMVVQVEGPGSSSSLYKVSILGDPHGRWMCNLPVLNNVPLAVGAQVQIAENGS